MAIQLCERLFLKTQNLPVIRHFLIFKAFLGAVYNLLDFPLFSYASFEFILRLFYIIFELIAISIAGILCCLFFVYGYSFYLISAHSWKRLRQTYVYYTTTQIEYQKLPYAIQRRFIETLSAESLRKIRKTNKRMLKFTEMLRGIPIEEMIFDFDYGNTLMFSKELNDEAALMIPKATFQRFKEKMRRITNLKRLAIVDESSSPNDYWKQLELLPFYKLDSLFFDGSVQDFTVIQKTISKFTPDKIYCQILVRDAAPPSLNDILEIFNKCKANSLICVISPAILFPIHDDLDILKNFYKQNSCFSEIIVYLQQSEVKWRKFLLKGNECGFEDVDHVTPFDFSKWILFK